MTHKAAAGAVRTGLDSQRQIAAAVREFRDLFGARLRGVIVQPMAGPATEMLIGVSTDPLCGPLLTLGLGGTSTDLVNDRAHCLLPATESDLDALLDGLRAAPRLFRPEGSEGPAGIRSAVRDVVARVAWLAEQLPELTEAEINPVIVGTGDPLAVDMRIRLGPVAPADPWLRSLPT